MRRFTAEGTQYVSAIKASESSGLVLYYRPNCPFCVRVLEAMKGVDIKIDLKDLNENREYLDELIEMGGKRQVPCLMIDGEVKYESQAIIDYLGALSEVK